MCTLSETASGGNGNSSGGGLWLMVGRGARWERSVSSDPPRALCQRHIDWACSVEAYFKCRELHAVGFAAGHPD